MAQEVRIISFDVNTRQDAEYEISHLIGQGWEIAGVIPHNGFPTQEANTYDTDARATPGGFVILVG